jgi:DNA-binding NarL/FixJ family response regulator
MSLGTLLVLAEERLLGAGLASALGRRYETNAAESPERAADLIGAGGIDIVLWLGDRLDGGAVAQLTQLEDACPNLRLCVLACAADAPALQALVRGEHAGLAVLLRGGELDIPEVVESVESVLAGRSQLESPALERMVERGHDPLRGLSSQEKEVLELVAAGLRNREIARRTHKSEKAVEKRVSIVFQKLGLGCGSAEGLDRRVAAARIFFDSRPPSVTAGLEWV